MGKTAVVNYTTLVICLVAELIVMAGCGWGVYYGSRKDEDGALVIVCGIGGLMMILILMATVFTAMGIK
jgi:hypothetical protein